MNQKLGSQMNERIIFNHKGVIVSYNYMEVDKKRYPIENIIGCEPGTIKPKYLLARCFLFGGIPLVFAAAWYPVLGLSLMFIGLVLFKIAKIRYALIIQTTDGSLNPVISENLLNIENVAAALTVALAMRDSRKLAIGW
jgi:hypothetical protein